MWLSAPLDPLTVSVEVDLVVVEEVLTVMVVLPPLVGLTLKEPRAPEGSPLTLKLTAPVKPPVRVMVTV